MNGYRNYSIGILSALLILLMGSTQIAGAWVLNGTIFNGATCAPLPGVNVSAQNYPAAPNVSNTKGQYNLQLGTGNYSVMFVKSGFGTSYYATPYESSGALSKNISLVPTGGVAKNCGKNTTVLNSTGSTTIKGPGSTSVSTAASTSVTLPPSSMGLSTTTIAAIVVVIIIIIVVIAWAMMRGGKKPAHHKG